MWIQTYEKTTEHYKFDDGEVDITADSDKRRYLADVVLNDGTEFRITQRMSASSADQFLELARHLLEENDLSEK